LKKKIEVKFPTTVDGRVIVKVYDEEYAVWLSTQNMAIQK
jgi:hypothetical protein